MIKMNNIFSKPNQITFFRIILTPVFLIFLLMNLPYNKYITTFIFILLSVSDMIDGYFARKKKQITELGKILDPIADKLLISTALIFLVGKGIDLWVAVTIITREVIITALRIYLLPKKIIVSASSFGKAKTVVQSIAIIFILLGLPLQKYIILAAVLLTIVSGLEYIMSIRRITGTKVVNLPNLITLIRFLLIMPFVYYFLNMKMNITLSIFAVIALSDKLDGISARIMNQKTNLGSWLDSLTDYILIITTLIILVIKGYINILWLIVFVIPSIIIWLMKLTYAKKKKVVPVTFVARLSACLTYITITSILISFGYKINFEYNLYLMIGAVVMVYLAMIVYVFKAFSLSKIFT